jgi:hypothetical protein
LCVCGGGGGEYCVAEVPHRQTSGSSVGLAGVGPSSPWDGACVTAAVAMLAYSRYCSSALCCPALC